MAAVALGGSWPPGDAHPDSDLELGIYYQPGRPPSVEECTDLRKSSTTSHLPNLATKSGEWGPWINGGGWLWVDGRSVDWLYRDAGKVAATVERCLSGQTACHYQPGHPHGFHEHIYLGEVHYCRALHDPEGLLSELKSAVAAYPAKLKHSIIEKGLWEAEFSLEVARKPAARGRPPMYPDACFGVWPA